MSTDPLETESNSADQMGECKSKLQEVITYFFNLYHIVQGQTGFPWIDAIMVQLRTEGWIHQLTRHAVISFLTRGDLWISWEDGMKIFAELMLDADWSVNAGTWMWLSGSSFFLQFFSVYCPVKFGRKVDPNGEYIRRYLPVLKVYKMAFEKILAGTS